MPLYLNYRTPFENFTGKVTKRLEGESIENWFKDIWRLDLNDEELYKYYLQKFQTHFYGLGHLASNVVERKIQQPQSVKELETILKENSYINEIKIENEKYLEVLTDDDEFSLAWYIIEEEYAKSDLNRFAYLIYEDWELPLKFAKENGVKLNFEFKNIIQSKKSKEGELYFISICNNSGEGPIDYYPIKINGIRLPDLNDLLTKDELDFEKLPQELIYFAIKLKEQDTNKSFINRIREFQTMLPILHKLFHSNIDYDYEKMTKGFEEAKEEFKKSFANLLENESSDFNKINEVHLHGNEHLIQIAIQSDFWESHPVDADVKNSKVFDQIFIFDDLWVKENKQLANSLMNYYTNWKL